MRAGSRGINCSKLLLPTTNTRVEWRALLSCLHPPITLHAQRRSRSRSLGLTSIYTKRALFKSRLSFTSMPALFFVWIWLFVTPACNYVLLCGLHLFFFSVRVLIVRGLWEFSYVNISAFILVWFFNILYSINIL